MLIIVLPTKDDTGYLLWKAEGCACKESLTQSLEEE